MLAGDPLWLLEQGTDILPESLFQQIDAHLLVPTEALSPEPVGVTADAPVVGIGASPALGRLETDRFAVVGVTAGPTDQQPLQQVPGPSPTLALSPAIVLQLLLNRIEQLGFDNRRDRDRDLFVHGHIVDRVDPPRLCRIASLGPQTRSHRPIAGLAVGGHPLVRGVLQHAPDGRTIPPGFPRRRGNALFLQPAADFLHRESVPAHPDKDLPDHADLLQNDLVGGMTIGHSSTDIAIPIVSAPEHIDRAVTCGVQLAATIPLGDLGPFVPAYAQSSVLA
jgi:hypothetical protein